MVGAVARVAEAAAVRAAVVAAEVVAAAPAPEREDNCMLYLQPRPRAAFTLLEVVLAVSLSVVLLSALYVALSMHYFETRAGREIMDETIITRSVVNRIAQDMVCELPPIDPRLLPGQNSSSGGGASGAAASGAGGAAGGGAGTAGANTGNNSGSSNSGASSNTTSATGTQVTSNLQVYGDQNNLVLTGRTVPHDLTQPPQSQPTLTSDLRRVTYWVVPGKGLARLEVTQVTGGDALVTPPTIPPTMDQPDSAIISHEVNKIVFEYYDGTTWQESWDGSSPDPSGTTSRPKGPPAAIAFTVTLAIPTHGPQKTRAVTYRHVVPIHTANNFMLASSSNPGNNASGASNSSGSSSSSPKSTGP